MNCSEMMSRNVECCLPTDTVQRAAQLMKQEDVGVIPIVTRHETKTLIGIVTDRDFVLNVVADGRDPRTIKLEQVMTRTIISCRPEDDVQKCLDAMADHQVRRMPVVDSNGGIVGIISQADIATRVDDPQKTAEVLEEISRSRAMGGGGV